MSKCHEDVGDGIPEDMGIPFGATVYLKYTSHALDSARRKKHLIEGEDSLNLQNRITITRDNVFEAEQEENGLKVAVRTDYDETRDIIYAILLDGGINDPLNECTLKTVYTNHVNDHHDTLDESSYL